MKRFTAILAALLCLTPLAAIPARALNMDVLPREVITDAGTGEIRKIYELPKTVDPKGIPSESFTRGGVMYECVDVLREEIAKRETKSMTEPVTASSRSSDAETVRALLPDTREVATEDGFEGTLRLDEATIQTEVSGYGTSSRTVSATRSYPNLSDQDLSYIPKTVESEGRTLELADVQWQTVPVSNASDGELAERYTALATYSVELSSSYVSGYTVTAVYTGEVHRPEDAVLRYTAIFAPLPDGRAAAANAPPEVTDTPEPAAPAGAPGAESGGAQPETAAPQSSANAGLVIALVVLSARRIRLLLPLLLLLPVIPAMAADSVEGADPGGFGKSTSVDPIVTGGETNLDRGKNSASLPPPFGSDGVNYPAADDPLTPGLAERSDAYASVASGTTPELPPLSEEPTSADTPGAPGVRFTPASAVTQADGSLGRLRIPAIGLDVRVWEGESLANLAKGVGHFSATSAWDGNVAVAGHNRGTAAWFAQLHTLKIGDRITYETCLGTRAYAVVSVARIAETDWSQLQASSENTLTLVTCVRDVPELRWCVQAREVA